jgi:hypothetical protein
VDGAYVKFDVKVYTYKKYWSRLRAKQFYISKTQLFFLCYAILSRMINSFKSITQMEIIPLAHIGEVLAVSKATDQKV